MVTMIVIAAAIVLGAFLGAVVMYLYIAGELRGWFDRR